MSDQSGPSVTKVVRAALLSSLAASTVAACGGGGGGGGGSGSLPPSPMLPPTSASPTVPSPAPTPVVSPPSTFETTEYFGAGFGNNQSGLAQIHASTAYSHGATGDGVTVAVIDSGIDTSISELSGQVAASYDVNASGRSLSDIDHEGHGTLVSSVIAARKNNTGIHGVAYESKILSIRADSRNSCGTAAKSACSFSDASLASAINYALSKGVKIINISLGGEIDTDPTLENAIRNAASQGVLVVIAAGNEGKVGGTTPATGASPTEPAYIAGQTQSLGRVVAVGAVDKTGAMPTFSNRAGQTANYYLLAPGVRVITAGPDDNITNPGGADNDADSDGQYYAVTGTSFAAPHVAGALALMLDLYPNIKPEDALNALLESADDYVTTSPDAVLGVPAAAGTDNVGGRGILNLQRAFSPIGQTSFKFNGRAVELVTALSPASGALGDWVDNSGAFDGLVFQDKFQRAFRVDTTQMSAPRSTFNDFSVRANHARGQSRAMSMGDAQISWFNAPRPTYDPRMPWAEAPEAEFQLSYSLADADISVGRGGGPQRLTPGMMLIDDPSGPTTLGSGDSWSSYTQSFGPMKLDVRTANGVTRNSSSFGLGAGGDDWAMRLGYAALTDSEATLGGTFQSRFGGEDQTRLSAVSLEARRYLGNWAFSGALEAASARVNTMSVSGLWTSAWSVSAEHPVAGGWMRFTAGQPRRAEGGSLDFDAPIEVTRDGVILYERRVAGLTPSGREFDLEAAWSTNLGDLTTFEAAAALSNQPHHIAEAEAEAAMWLSLRHAW